MTFSGISSLSGLSGVQSNLQNVLSEFSNFVANGNQAHLTNALSHLDNAANISAWTFFNRPVRGAKPQFESVASVRKAAEKAIASVDARAAETQESIAETAAKIQAQDERLAQLNAAMEEVRSNSSAAVASIQQQFSESQSSFRNELDALKKSFQTEREELVQDFSNDAQGVIKDLEGLKDKAAKIVQVVGNIGVTGDYQSLANKENEAADRWRLITLVFFVLGIGLVSAVLLHHLFGDESSGIASLVVRFALAAVVTLPALYAASESSRHRRVAEQARRTELQLASLSPFLATLPEEKRNEIIEGLAPSYFVGSPRSSVDPVPPEERFDLAKVLSEIGNIVSRAKS